jgi:hypothetical protein
VSCPSSTIDVVHEVGNHSRMNMRLGRLDHEQTQAFVKDMIYIGERVRRDAYIHISSVIWRAFSSVSLWNSISSVIHT